MSKDGSYKGYIYAIKSKNVEKEQVYVGCTGSSLKDRFNSHVRSYRRWKEDNSKGFLASFKLFEKYGINGVYIEELDSIYYKQFCELTQLEGKHQRENNCVNIVTNNDQPKIYKSNIEYSNRPLMELDMKNNTFKNFIYEENK